MAAMVHMPETCSLCHAKFEDPRMLKCKHIFCFKCIKQCVAKQQYKKSMLCSICKTLTRFPKGELDDIPSSELHSDHKSAEGHHDNSQGQKGLQGRCHLDQEINQHKKGFETVQVTKECYICHEGFDDPRQLACDHVFCLKCLKQVMAKQRYKTSLICPHCDVEIWVTEDKLESLPVSQQSMQQTTASHHDQSQEICATSGCNKATHFATHVTLSVEAGSQLEANSFHNCPKHHGQLVSWYCLDCEICTCSTCFYTSHNRHRYMHVSAMADDAERQLKNMVEKMKGCIERCNTITKQGKATIEQTHDNFKGEVTRKIGKINTELLLRKKGIEDAADQIYQQALHIQERENKPVTQLQNLEYESSQLLRQGILSDYITTVVDIRKRLQALESTGIYLSVPKLDTTETEKKLCDLKSYEELQNQSRTLVDQKKTIEDLKKTIRRQSETNKELENAYSRINAENEDLKITIKKLTHESEDLKKKYNTLAVDYGKSLASELSMDDSKSENISTQCRPSVLREKYVHLSYQNAGIIKTSVPVDSAEITKEFKCTYMDQLFSAIYMTTCRGMTNVHNKQHRAIHFWLTQPIEASINKSHPGKQEKTLTTSLLQALTKYTKDASSDVIMTDAIKPILYASLKDTEEKLTGHGVEDACLSLMRYIIESAVLDDSDKKEPWAVNLTEWIRSLCNLAWQMALQNPPLTIETPRIGERIDLNNDKIIPPKNMDFDRSDEYVIDYYLEPHLMHGKELMEAGRVKVRLQTNTEPDVISDRPSCDKANIRYSKPTDKASLEGSQKNRECSQKESPAEYTGVKPELRIDDLNYKDCSSNSGHSVVINNKPQYSRKETPGHEHDGDDVDSAPGNELVVSDQMDYPRKTL